MKKITNQVNIENLNVLDVTPNISKLLMSEYEDDFLLGWELVEDHPNCEYIRAYCKGATNIISGLDWSKYSHYYNYKEAKYTFGDIIIKD